MLWIGLRKLVIVFVGLMFDPVGGKTDKGNLNILPQSDDRTALSEAVFSIPESLNEHVPLELYVIYDDEHKEMIRNLPQFPDHFRGATFLAYEKAMKILPQILKRPESEAMIIALCSTERTLLIFQTIKDKKMRCSFALWLLVLKDSKEESIFKQGLEDVILEGTSVTLLTQMSRLTFEISVSRADLEGIPRFHDIRTIDMTDEGSLKNRYPPSLFLPDNNAIYADMKGRQLIVASNNISLFSHMGPPDEEGRVYRHTGIDFSIMDTVSKRLNFTYITVKSIDGGWGALKKDGTATGLIGMVYRREADFAVAHVGILGSRLVAVDFTITYYIDTLAIISRAPSVRNPTFIVFMPFTATVWLCVIVAIVGVAPLLKLLSEASKEAGFEGKSLGSFQTITFSIFRVIVIQGDHLRAWSWWQRIFLYSWYLFCLILSALYSGTLVAVLTVPSYEKPIDSLKDLPRAISEGFSVGTRKNTGIETIFRGAREGIYLQTWNLFNQEDLSKSLLPGKRGVDLVTETKFAYIFVRADLEAEAVVRGETKYYLSQDPFFLTFLAFPCIKGAPFLENVNQVMYGAVEGGFVNKWKEDEFRNLKKKQTTKERSGHRAIKLVYMQAAFYVLLLGGMTATGVLVLENVYALLNK